MMVTICYGRVVCSPWHPWGLSPVDVVTVRQVWPSDVFDNKVDVVFAPPQDVLGVRLGLGDPTLPDAWPTVDLVHFTSCVIRMVSGRPGGTGQLVADPLPLHLELVPGQDTVVGHVAEVGHLGVERQVVCIRPGGAPVQETLQRQRSARR